MSLPFVPSRNCRSSVCSKSLVLRPVTLLPQSNVVVGKYGVSSCHYRCGHCSRFVVECTACPSAPAYTIETSRVGTLHSKVAVLHFSSPAHAANLPVPSANSLPAAAAFSPLASAASDDFDGLHNGSDPSPSVPSCLADQYQALRLQGTDPSLSDFTGLFPNSSASAQFFEAEHLVPASGTARAVSIALRGSAANADVHPKETDVNMRLFSIAQKLGVDDAGKLFAVIHQVRHDDECVFTARRASNPFAPKLQVPTDRKSVRSAYFTALPSLLPLPSVVEVARNLTYCSPVEVVRHALAFDVNKRVDCLWSPTKRATVTSLSESARAADIVFRCMQVRGGVPSFVVQLLYWEDDADTNKLVKQATAKH